MREVRGSVLKKVCGRVTEESCRTIYRGSNGRVVGLVASNACFRLQEFGGAWPAMPAIHLHGARELERGWRAKVTGFMGTLVTSWCI